MVDLARLQVFVGERLDVMVGAQELLTQGLPSVPLTPRLKTVSTIVDKLKRERRMALSNMRDVVGFRIVDRMNRVEQDVLVRDVIEVLGNGILIDRRARPSHGYRAVHIEAMHDGCPIEVQVRTWEQDQWAQIVEKMGDAWGRQIRYGGPPDDPEKEVVPSWSRQRLWEVVLSASDLVDGMERAVAASHGQDLSEEAEAELAGIRQATTEILETLARVEITV